MRIHLLKNVLIVEDDQDLAEITMAHLRHKGYEVEWVDTCQKAKEKLETTCFSIILLDEVLPDRRGSDLCKEIHTYCTCPIIFMSCLGESSDVINAFRSGGDDYVVKPIKYEELLVRMETVLNTKELKSSMGKGVEVFAQFWLDTQRHRLIRKGIEVELSNIEYGILRYFIQHQNTLLLYDDIYQSIWDSESGGDIRTVMVHISNLRKKIDPHKSGMITTIRNAGYIFSNI